MRNAYCRDVCLLFLVTLAFFCRATIAADDPQTVAMGNLRLHGVPAQQRVELFYRDQLVAANIAEFELYALAAGGARKRLLRGPGLAIGHVKRSESSLSMHGNDGEHAFNLVLRLAANDTLQVELQLEAPLRLNPCGIEFDLIYFLSDAVKGGRVIGNKGVLPAKPSVPMDPLPADDRHIVRDQARITLAANSFTAAVTALQDSAPLSLTDLRGVEWDKNKTILLYSSNRPLIPGKMYRYAYSIQWQPPLEAMSVSSPTNAAPVVQVSPAEVVLGVDRSRQPALPIRGQVVELLPPARKDMALFKRYIDAMISFGVNTVLFYHTPEHVDDLHLGKVPITQWSRAELQDVAGYARAKGLRVMAGMSTRFSATRFAGEWFQPAGSDFYCVDQPAIYDKLFELYDTLLQIYRPEAMHIGHDEIRLLQGCKEKGTETAELLRQDIERLHAWLKARGVGTIIWGDMLLDHTQWEGPVGSAHSNNPAYRSGATHRALEQLPRDIVIADWHYAVTGPASSLDFFRRKGFRVWGVSWYQANAAVQMVRSAITYGAEGILGSDWGFWRTLSPAATTPVAWVAGWDPAVLKEFSSAAAVGQLARQLREPLPNAEFANLPLGTVVNSSRADPRAYDGKDLFDMGPGLDFSLLPAGRSVWQGIAFELSQVVAGQADVIVLDGKNRRSVTVPLPGLQTNFLAFLHSMYASRPTVEPRPVGRYEVVYADGSVLNLPLLENINITDLRSSPGIRANPWGFNAGIDELLGAWPGWRGNSRSGVPLNSQILLWHNPQPQKRITAIRVIAEPASCGCKLALLALSAAAS